MTTELLARRPIPPYIPPRTFFGYLDSLKAFGPSLPLVIDRDSMRSYSGTMQSWLLNAMRYLNMIDENGTPKPRLAQIVHAAPATRKALLQQVIAAEYSFLKHLDLKLVTQRQIEKEFEATGAQGDTVRKCVSFFLGLAKEAELPLSPYLEKKKRRGGARGQRRMPANGNGGKTTVPLPVFEPVVTKSKSQMLLDILDPQKMSDAEQNAVWTLLKYLKGSE